MWSLSLALLPKKPTKFKIHVWPILWPSNFQSRLRRENVMTTARAPECPLNASAYAKCTVPLSKGTLTPIRTKAEVQASSETSTFEALSDSKANSRSRRIHRRNTQSCSHRHLGCSERRDSTRYHSRAPAPTPFRKSRVPPASPTYSSHRPRTWLEEVDNEPSFDKSNVYTPALRSRISI